MPDQTEAAGPLPMIPATHQHTQAGAIPPFSELTDPATASPRWKVWISRLDNYFTATRETDGAVKRSWLLHYAGDEIYKLFAHLPNTGDHTDYDAAVQALNAHFDPQLNPDYECFKLRQARQWEGESMDTFHARLRELASTCTEDDQSKEVRAQVIQGFRNKFLRTLILRQPCITLEDILILARSNELSDIRASAMEATLNQPTEQTVTVKTERIDAVRAPTSGGRGKWTNKNSRRPPCGYCGKEAHRPDECPARGKTCANCGIPNHFASVCRGRLRGRGTPGCRPPARAV